MAVSQVDGLAPGRWSMWSGSAQVRLRFLVSAVIEMPIGFAASGRRRRAEILADRAPSRLAVLGRM